MLQETHSIANVEKYWKSEWGYEAFFSGNSTNSGGVGILINNNFPYSDINVTEFLLGHVLVLKVKIEELELIIINVYGPNRDDATFYQKIGTLLENNEAENIIIGGDFNVILNPELDKINGIPNRNIRCRRVIKSIMDKNELLDIWRVHHEQIKQYTWKSNHTPPIKCRLDYFLTSVSLLNVIENSEIITGIRSDHEPVTLTLCLNKEKRGPGYFKINNSILLDNEYQEKIKSSIEDIVEFNSGSDPCILWELIKGTIRNETIRFSSKKAKKQKTQELKLQAELKILNERLCQDKDNVELQEIIKGKKNELETIYNIKVQGLILRSKARWVENGEKNSKYFANLEKRNFQSRIIHKLNVDGKLITDPNNILKEEMKYYENLYEKIEAQSSNYDFFPENFDQKLENENRNKCEGLITEEECLSALKSMPNNKSPGSDGITTEFYKLIWKEIGKYLVQSINHSYENGHLNTLQKQSIISLIPKKDKDLEKLTNWRPISLLNTDYKIITKVIANRMKQVLPKIIDSSQTGFVKGRYIGENIRLILDMIEYTEENQLPGLLFFADFEKAFDSIDHSFMIKALQFFNFGPSIVNWVKVFYNDIQSCVTNNGYLSPFFNVKRGVRQGCPLSPYLFIICIELMSYAMRHDENVKGITIYNSEVKNTLFADDSTIILNGSEDSLKQVVNILEEFRKISGLKLNDTKSVILRIGSLKNTDITYLEENRFIWTSTSAKTLGVTFHTDLSQMLKLNLDPKINDFNKCIETWKKRNLSTLGKITVVKSFALPKLIYPLTVLPNPSEEIIKNIKGKMFEFIWNSKVNKVSQDIITKDYDEAGLKMIDINAFINSIKATWIKRIIDPNNTGQWKISYQYLLSKLGGEFFFKCNCNPTHLTKLLPKESFFRDIMQAWCKINYDKEVFNIKDQTLWNNSYIKRMGKPIIQIDWVNKGIKYIRDITQGNRFLSFDEVKQKFNLNNTEYLKYHKLIASIPTSWKVQIKEEEEVELNQSHLINKIKSVVKPCKMLYQIQMNKKDKPIKAHAKWEEKFQDENLDWKKIHMIPFNCTIDVKLRNFQYKFLMRIIATNKYLLQCRISPSSLCDFCNREIETLSHLFIECTYVQDFWRELENQMRSKGWPMVISNKDICFGRFGKENDLFNMLLICAKHFVYICKYRSIIPTYNHFQHIFKESEQVEKIIAQKNNTLNKHNNKWSKFPFNN